MTTFLPGASNYIGGSRRRTVPTSGPEGGVGRSHWVCLQVVPPSDTPPPTVPRDQGNKGMAIPVPDTQNESVVEPNLSLSCEAPRRGARRLRASKQSRVVAEPQPWHG